MSPFPVVNCCRWLCGWLFSKWAKLLHILGVWRDVLANPGHKMAASTVTDIMRSPLTRDSVGGGGLTSRRG